MQYVICAHEILLQVALILIAGYDEFGKVFHEIKDFDRVSEEYVITSVRYALTNVSVPVLTRPKLVVLFHEVGK